MKPNDIVRFVDEELDYMFGVGLVKKQIANDYFKIVWEKMAQMLVVITG